MRAFDCNCKLSYELALRFKSDGYDVAIRYVGRLKQASIDIDKVELNNILRAKLGLGIVQHCPPKPGIIPTRELGITYGKNAVIFAKEAGYKEGCIEYLDLEDVNPEYSKKQTLIYDYCNYWYDNVYKTYLPGLYVGFNTYLSGDELFYKLKYRDYWKGISRVPDVTKRGYAMVQGKQIIPG